MKTKSKLVATVVLTFLVPPGIVIWLGNFTGLIVGEKLERLIYSAVLPLFTVPLIVGIPLLINFYVKNADKFRGSNINKFAAYLKLAFTVYVVSSILYGLVSIPVTWLLGYEARDTILGSLNAVFLILLMNVPFYMKYLQFQDEFCKGLHKSGFLNFSIGNKMLLTNISSALGAIGLLANNSIILIETHTVDGVFNTGSYVSDLAIVSLIIFVLLIIPNRIISIRLVKSTGKLSQLANKIASKNLSDSAILHDRDEIGRLGDDLNSLKDTFKTIVSDSRTIAVELDDSSNSLKTLSGSLSEISNELAANAEEIAASMEEMASNILLSAENAGKSETLTKEGHNSMLIGQELVNQTSKSIATIAEKVRMIEEIAEQTNMLAINAFVEAANAGANGKGFAVVAKEVRVLADRSMEAANEISNLTQACLKDSNESKEKINSVVELIKKTMQMSSEIALSTKEQETGSNQINNAVQEFNSKTQQIASSSEELEASATEVKERAALISGNMRSFKIN